MVQVPDKITLSHTGNKQLDSILGSILNFNLKDQQALGFKDYTGALG